MRPIILKGNWTWGLACDIHTIHSARSRDDNGDYHWDNTRSEMGELLYKLKHKNNIGVVNEIVTILISTINELIYTRAYPDLEKLVDLIILVPPSQRRPYQPVYEICIKLGEKLNIPIGANILKKTENSPQLKNINDPKKREELLKKSMSLTSKHDIEGKNVLLILLIDDLYRSGATLRAATELLYSSAKVENVYVLTMTKTRTKK